jgi:dTDP-4-amino-4,6-dideoxygalactose transaminase
MHFQKPENFIPFSPPWFDDAEERELIQTLRSGWITTGPRVKQFESQVAAYTGAEFGVATFSCTHAMLLALRVLEIGEGDEVITTPYTFPSTSHAICHHRARPVFVDVEPDTFNIDAERIEAKVTDRTRAILPVHFAGHPCDMDAILDVARRHHLFVVEDAAHAIGSKYKDRPIGSVGDITCFSFYATKNLCTAEGGMAVTDRKPWAERMRVLSMYGITDAREIWQDRTGPDGSIHFDVTELGYKCNMTDLTAALGMEQLKKLNRFNQTRREFARIYDDAFKGQTIIQVPVARDYATSSRHLYPLLMDLNRLAIARDAFVAALADLNIGTSVMFVPLHYHRYYADLLGHGRGDFPVAEDLFSRVICLPLSPKLGERAIRVVAEAVLYLLEKHRR